MTHVGPVPAAVLEAVSFDTSSNCGFATLKGQPYATSTAGTASSCTPQRHLPSTPSRHLRWREAHRESEAGSQPPDVKDLSFLRLRFGVDASGSSSRRVKLRG